MSTKVKQAQRGEPPAPYNDSAARHLVRGVRSDKHLAPHPEQENDFDLHAPLLMEP